MTEFAKRLSTKVIGIIPRSNLVQSSEFQAQTVIETFPDSDQSKKYIELMDAIMDNGDFVNPTTMDVHEFEEFFYSYL